MYNWYNNGTSMSPVFESTLLYTLVEMGKANMSPFRLLLKSSKEWNEHPLNPLSSSKFSRTINAIYDVTERITRDYDQPKWMIKQTVIDGQLIDVDIHAIKNKPFCKLVHFKKRDFACDMPKILVVAPMSGHYPTLLRGTVEGLLPHFDVYITEWINAKNIPLSDGHFDLEDYTTYVIDFIEVLKGDVHVMAVCQPCVPVAAAIALMSAEKNKYVPKSMILIGGPIDIRKSPTAVNVFAEERSVGWFKHNMITRVPIQYSGFMRLVYPGFIQLAGFLAMNPQKHLDEHIKLFKTMVIGDEDSEDTHKKFYDEYLAVMDMPAEFYLQTIKLVFHDCALPLGNMTCKARPVNLKAISKTSLLVIEGELDDITGRGQTKAAIELCSNIADNKKHYHLQKSVGHYGQFNGSKFKKEIVPLIKDFCVKHNECHY